MAGVYPTYTGTSAGAADRLPMSFISAVSAAPLPGDISYCQQVSVTASSRALHWSTLSAIKDL
jgi:hypothetical protein